MLMNTQVNCPYGSIWYRELAKASYRFIDNDAYVDVALDSCVSLDEALASNDKVLLYWRWRFSEADKTKTEALARQYELLAKVPERCIVLDGDHQLTFSDTAMMNRLGVPVIRPELKRHDSVMYPYFESLERETSFAPGLPLCYIGTPADRLHQMQYYCQQVPTDLYGSWAEMPGNFTRHGKLDNDLLIDRLAGRVTIVLAKRSYYAAGYITPRWYECAYAGCAVIVPGEYADYMPQYMAPWVAKSSVAAKRLYDTLSENKALHACNVAALRRYCKSIADTKEWLLGFPSVSI